MFPCKDGHASFTPQEGIWKRSVPETSPCHVQARQDGKLDPRKGSVPAAAVFAPLGVQRSSAASRAARVGGDGDRYASAQLVAGSARGQPRVDSSRSKVSVTGTRANPNVRGRAGVAGESRGIVVPREDSRVALALAPQFGEQLLVPGRDGSTAVHDRLSGAIRLMYLWVIVRILASPGTPGERGRNLLGEEPLRIKRLLLPP